MNVRAEPEDLSSSWTRHLRQSAVSTESYACPHCPDKKIFHLERRLFQHAQDSHPEYFERAKDDGELAELRTQLREDARHKGKNVPRKPRGQPQIDPLQVQGQKGGPARQAPSKDRRPVSAGALGSSTSHQAREIGDISALSLSQDVDTLMQDDSEDRSTGVPLSPLGSRKRAAGADTGSLDVAAHSNSPSSDSRTRRSKARSGSAIIGGGVPSASAGTEFRRSLPKASAGDPSRPSSGRGKKLYNPTTDDPLSRSGVELSNASLATPFASSFESRGPLSKSRHEVGRRQESKARPYNVRQAGEKGFRSTPQANTQSINVPEAEDKRGTSGLLYLGTPVEKDPILIPQPETRPISIDQLVAEVKGIYAGLLMVEARCIEVDSKEASAAQEGEAKQYSTLSDEQYQALIALHRTLLYEHHDFFLASQHPSASPALRRLASKYSMPARMWRHGIHSFLELLRHRLPKSLDHMLAFIYLAYSMMALLYETVPTFIDTWVECLGDLARYRMAVEDDSRDREVWTGVARSWYNKSADRNPSIGRLYHHLAILARSDALEQLYYYCRSLTCIQPFLSARESVLTLFDPVLSGSGSTESRALPLDSLFIRLHGQVFSVVGLESFDQTLEEFLILLDSHIGQITAKWKDQGFLIAVSNIAALFEYGLADAILRVAFGEAKTRNEVSQKGDATQEIVQGKDGLPSTAVSGSATGGKGTIASTAKSQTLRESTSAGATSDHTARSHITLSFASKITFSTFALALERLGDENVMPHVHVMLVFLLGLTNVPSAMELVEQAVPWKEIVVYLNTLVDFTINDLKKPEFLKGIRKHVFPRPENGNESGRPLPEDFAIRGQLWSETYFPAEWFEHAMVDDEERRDELPSMADPRRERVLWLGAIIASSGEWLDFDDTSNLFSIGSHVKEFGVYGSRKQSSGKQNVQEGDSRQPEDRELHEDNVTETRFNNLESLDDDSLEMRALPSQQDHLRTQLSSDKSSPEIKGST
ncbi:MAG: hypothetical protein M1837_004558 [Sclerophora amabilis]|nr:MAG: hypothetical protein M1837_004558 [Sclerophora amabilis]